MGLTSIPVKHHEIFLHSDAIYTLVFQRRYLHL